MLYRFPVEIYWNYCFKEIELKVFDIFHFQLQSCDKELSQLRAALTQYENLTNEYKSQLERCRGENDDLNHQMRKQEKETQAKIQGSMQEVNEVSFHDSNCHLYYYILAC